MVLGNTEGIGRGVWSDYRCNTCEILPKPGRVPQRWLDLQKKRVKQILYLTRSVDFLVSKEIVKLVVKACKAYQSTDPVPVHWKKGKLAVEINWSRLPMDITHNNSGHFLMLIDCGPSRFAICRPLRWQDATSVICQLVMTFFEHGLPKEVLTDNDTTFTCRHFKEFVSAAGVCTFTGWKWNCRMQSQKH